MASVNRVQQPRPAAVAAQPAPIVVIGTGPVGMRVVREILSCDPRADIVAYGNEPYEPYNRVRLSSLLTGQDTLAGIYDDIPLPPGASVVLHHNCPVVALDRRRKTVTDSLGREQPYTKLVIATGSRARLPQLPNMHLTGVYKFRDLKDAERLLARSVRTRHTVVLGGGLLGLEAARGMRRRNTHVTVVDGAPHLMSRQLDERAGELVREHVVKLGIAVILRDGIAELIGGTELEAVRLRSGGMLPCDTLVIAAGITPNTDLAKDAGLSYGRGIRVNDHLQTSDPDIYAAGECAEHRDTVYGIVAPGFEQAAVLARHITGGSARYTGSLVATALKVVGKPVFSVGQVGEAEPSRPTQNHVYEDVEAGIYRRLTVQHRRLIGAVAVGDWPEQGRIREAIERRRRVWPWDLKRFAVTGLLWSEEEADCVADWPSDATVCNCTHASRGRLGSAIKGGCTTLEQLSRATGAGSVCGSCKPLLTELLGARMPKVPGFRTLLALCSLVLLAVSILAGAPPIHDAASAADPVWRSLWRDGLYKQVSGYALLACTGLVLLLSLRKRVDRFAKGSFDAWRLFHVAVGLAALAVLAVHTGLRFGTHLNFYLMVSFCGLIGLGGLAGLVIANEHRLSPSAARRLRGRLVWLHILLFWPLPALLAFHIVQAYYF